MVICIKCGKEQSRRSGSECEYDGSNIALKEHTWEDRGEFIDELREKLPPFIRERIAQWRKKYAEKQTLFTARLKDHGKSLDQFYKWLDQQRATYAAYLNEELPHDVKKKKQRAVRYAIRSLLRDVIGLAIGIFIGLFIVFKWIFPKSVLEIITTPYIIIPVIAAAVYIFGKPVVKYLKAKRYAESQNFADEVVREWCNDSGFDKSKSNIEAMIEMEKDDIAAAKDEWNKISGSFERCIHDAECALVGSDEELLRFYKMDKKTKHWYVEKIYDGEW